MKKKYRLGMLCALLMLLLIPTNRAQAASTTNYVMAGETTYTFSENKAVSNASVNGYHVKIHDGKLSVRKGSGSWKVIASSSGMDLDFTTNGKTIYYATGDNDSTTIYSISINGSNKKKVTQLSQQVSVCYRYGDKLFYNNWSLTTASYYSLSTKQTKRIRKSNRIYGANKQYVLLKGWTTGGDACPEPLYSFNASTGKQIRLAKKAHDYAVALSGSRVYYADWLVQAGYGKKSTFRIKSCKLSGTGYRTETKKFKATNIVSVTASYVRYQKVENGKIYKIKY